MSINTTRCLKTPCDRQPFTLAPASSSTNGVVLRVHHTISTPYGSANQLIRFLHASFNSTGEALAASNHLGNVYTFDFAVNKYWLLVHVNCSIIKFVANGDLAKDVLLVGTTAGEVRVYNSHSGQHVSDLKGHMSPVTDISFSDANECVTLANNEAILWNLENYTKLQVLHLEEGAILKFVLFIPVCNDVVACFADETVQIWKAKTFEPLKQITSNNGSFNKLSIRSIAFTSNGKLMAIVGHAPTVFVFELDTLQLKKEFTFPEMHFSIRRAQFLPNLFDDGVNKILSFLTSSGALCFYNMELEVFIGKVSMDDEIWKYAIDPSSNRIATISKCGEVQLHSLAHVLTKLNRDLIVRSVPGAVHNKIKGKAKCKVGKKVPNDAIKQQLTEALDTNKLKAILREFGEYPSMYRKLIWRHLLQLPNDVNQYAAISSIVFENAFFEFDKLYPLDVRQDMKCLKRFVLNIVSWCPFLSVVSYLPVLIFPFVKFLQAEPVLCFEALISLIVNYCQYWFEYHPVPPLNILGLVESIIIQQDVDLMVHFNKKGVTSKTYAWFILQSMFSEVLSSAHWLVFIDHMITNDPVFLIVAAAAFSLVNKTVLMSLNNTDDFEFFFRTNSTIDFKRFLARCYKLLNDKTMEHHPRLYLKPLEPFHDGEYPVFDQYPKNCLQVCQNINTLRSEVNSLKREGDVMDSKVTELKRLKELEKSSEEYIRQMELNKLYCDKLEEETLNVGKQRKRLESLRSQVLEKERDFCSDSQQIMPSFVSDGKTVTNSQSDSECCGRQFNKVEENLLQQYTNLLKHKIQIEGLIDDDASLDFVQLKKSYKEISDEINRTQAKMTIPHKEYLKQLNVITGLAAVNSLIQKVESKISNRTTSLDRSKTRYVVAKLASESEELSREINKLMTLLADTK